MLLPKVPKRYVSGELFPYLGCNYRLKVRLGRENVVKLKRGHFNIFVLENEKNCNQVVKKILFEWYLGKAKKLLIKKNLKSRVIPYPKELEIYDQRLLKFNPKITYHFLKGLFIYNSSLKKEFHEISPDVVWCDNIRTLITIYPSCKSINAKIIWNIWSEPKGLIAWLLHRIGLILADKINLEYENQGKKIFGILNHIAFFKRKIIPLYTGVSDFEEFQGTDLRKELNLKDEEIILTMASNIVPGKGQLDLIKCIKNY